MYKRLPVFGRYLNKGLRFLCAAYAVTASMFAMADAPKRALDLRYGEALYAFHQDQYFDALTRLQVAKARGGIKGHGDHPLLLEGGLLLSYGMTAEAKRHFESLLAESNEEIVSQSIRNQAWFYLAKVYYIEGQFEGARGSIDRVDGELLLDSDEQLALEWRYLKSQLLFKQKGLDRSAVQAVLVDVDEFFPEESIWPIYVGYNAALYGLGSGEGSSIVTGQLESVLTQLELKKPDLDDLKEAESLSDRIRLSLAQIYLQDEDNENALRQLQQVNLDGPFSDEALFLFATVNAHLEQYSTAVQALRELESKQLFSPWLKQVPYASAYLFEQMGKVVPAAKAYRAAAEYYDTVIEQLDLQRSNMDETRLLSELELLRDTGYEAAVLGQEGLVTDSFGRLQSRPKTFELAGVFSQESFQLVLRDLHELYKLRDSLSQWDSQLESFDVMLETRAQQRAIRLQTVSQALAEQNAERWKALAEAYGSEIQRALEQEDSSFFMDEEQMDLAYQLNKAKKTFAQLPKDEDSAEYQTKLERSQALLDWLITDTYGVNRWAAQSALKKLDVAMEEFEIRNNFLKAEIDNTAFQQDLESRVEKGRDRLNQIEVKINETLDATRNKLLDMVQEQFDIQDKSLRAYRLASHRAKTRLEDQVYLSRLEAALASEVVDENPETEGSDPQVSGESTESVPTSQSSIEDTVSEESVVPTNEGEF